MKSVLNIIPYLIFLFILDYGLSKTPYPFTKTEYKYGFSKFYNHAKRTKGEQRIILTGGSSLGWGVSAKNLTEDLSILTLNSGINGSTGYKNISRLKKVIDKENDILVIAPEYDKLSATSDRSGPACFLRLYVQKEYHLECAFYTLNRIAKNWTVIHEKVNQFKHFNEFGDYTWKPVEKESSKPPFIDTNINIQKEISIFKRRVLPYFNSLKKEGYKIVYIPNLVPKDSTYAEHAHLFHKDLFKNHGVKKFKDVPLIIDRKYFLQGGDYHLTEKGVEIKTKHFKNHLQSYLEI